MKIPIDLPIVKEGLQYNKDLNWKLTNIFRRINYALTPGVEYGWKDLLSPIIASGVPPSSAPTLDTFGPSGTNKQYKFAVNDYIFAHPFHVNHDAKPNGQAYIHVHWTTNGTSTNTVKWQFEILRAKGHGQEAFSAMSTITVEQAPAGVAWQHMIAEVSDADALTLHEPDELFIVTLKRITNGGTDNTDKVFGLMVDFHYQADRDFTPYKSPNFYE